MRLQQSRYACTSLNERIVHFPCQTITLLQDGLKASAQLAESKLVNAPHRSSQQEHHAGEEPGSAIEVRPLNDLHRRRRNLFGIIHLESRHSKVIASRRKIGVVRDAGR